MSQSWRNNCTLIVTAQPTLAKVLNRKSTPNLRKGEQLLLILILLLAFALRVYYLSEDRFHADEALYAGWALRILDGDPLLLDEPVDKPPLFLYALAGVFWLFGSSEVAARWVNLACSLVGIVLVYRLAIPHPNPPPCATHEGGRDAFPYAKMTGEGLWAAFFLALSPFDILFARTAFTDSMLVMWWLAALLAAARGRWLAAGLFSGLAFATKQHAVMLIPAVLGMGMLCRPLPCRLGRFGLGFIVPWSLVTWWDSARWAIRPGYWDQSALSYGGLAWAPIAEWPARLLGWLGWARYLTGTWWLGLAFTGMIGLLVWESLGTRFSQTGLRPKTRFHALWAIFIFLYLAFHTVFNFSLWDRYLLPLAAPVAILGARMMSYLKVYFSARQSRAEKYTKNHIFPFLWTVLFILTCLVVGVKAAANGYPIGGDHWVYQGIDEIAAYLKQNAPPNAVLYHHLLRWHYTYYLYGAGLELRWWRDATHLGQETSRTDPTREQYIVLPDGPRDPTSNGDADLQGIRFVPVYTTHRRDGSESLRLYRIESP